MHQKILIYIYIYCDVVLFHAQRLFEKSLIFGNLEQKIMPEAVCDSQKSGVERNVLGRLLTLTSSYFCS